MGTAPSSASSTSRMAHPSGRSSLGSSTGARDSSGSSTCDHPTVQTQSRVSSWGGPGVKLQNVLGEFSELPMA